MASQLDHVILYPDAIQQFEDCILPMIQEDEKNLGHIDIPARSEHGATSLMTCTPMSRSVIGRLQTGSIQIVATTNRLTFP